MRISLTRFAQVLIFAGFTAATTASVAPTLAAQDVLWYSFESKTGDVPNRAAGGPRTAKLVSTNKGPDRVPGVFRDAQGGGDFALASFDEWDDKALRAKNYNYLDTGWTAGIKGSFSIGFYLRYGVVALNGGAQYLFGGDDGFRCFTEGRADQGLSIAGWGGIGYVDLDIDLRAATVNNWVHIVVVFDDKARKASWYVDGKFVSAVDLLGPIEIGPWKKGFRVGTNDTLVSPNVWQIDDFRLAKGIVSEEQIAIWRYESGKVGEGCQGSFSPAVGARPVLGKTYDCELRAWRNTTVVLFLGLSSTKFGALDLPLDLDKFIGDELKDCKWYISPDLLFLGKTDAGGLYRLPMPMPADPALAGAALWAQALFTWSDKSQTEPVQRWQSSNAWRIVFVPR